MKSKPEIGIIMGSDSDLIIMKDAIDIIEQFGIAYEVRIVSAHRTPQHMMDYATSAASKGIKIIIAGAGGAAHLPGMIASSTTIPVIGVPINSSNSLDGWDSILSILQMPNGIPVATVALNGAKNAGILACRILSINNPTLESDLSEYMEQMRLMVLEKDQQISARFG